MAKQTYSKEERKAQFLETGIKLAMKTGVNKVSAAAVAAEHKVTAPLVFHIFGSREKLQAAIKREAKKRGVILTEAAAQAPKRKRTVAEMKAAPKALNVTVPKKTAAAKPKVVKKAPAKPKVTVPKKTAATKPKAPAKPKVTTPKAAKKTAAPAKAPAKPKFSTMPVPAVVVPNPNPTNSL